MTELAGNIWLTWIVPHDEVLTYKEALRDTHAIVSGDVIAGGGLIDSRNLALDIAARDDLYCLQLSDDLRSVQWTNSNDNKQRRTIPLVDAVTVMEQVLLDTTFKLAGVAPTANAFFYRERYSYRHFIVGDFILVHPDSEARFDDNLTLKEDYDFTCQHWDRYGGAVRCNQILATFGHRTNKGGAVNYRTPALEEQNIAYLKQKWPGKFRDNPRREHEVLLKW